MSLRLGGDHRVRFRSKRNPGGDIVIVHRSPTSDEVNEYVAISAAAGVLGDDEKGFRTRLDKRMQLAIGLIKSVEGLDPEEGQTPIDTLIEYGGHILHAFTRHVFEVPFDVEVDADPGKSETPSVLPLPGGSVRSRARSASGLSK